MVNLNLKGVFRRLHEERSSASPGPAADASTSNNVSAENNPTSSTSVINNEVNNALKRQENLLAPGLVEPAAEESSEGALPRPPSASTFAPSDTNLDHPAVAPENYECGTEPGALVYFHGLVKRPDLNGHVGIVSSERPRDAERIAVQLYPERAMQRLVKPLNFLGGGRASSVVCAEDVMMNQSGRAHDLSDSENEVDVETDPAQLHVLAESEPLAGGTEQQTIAVKRSNVVPLRWATRIAKRKKLPLGFQRAKLSRLLFQRNDCFTRHATLDFGCQHHAGANCPASFAQVVLLLERRFSEPLALQIGSFLLVSRRGRKKILHEITNDATKVDACSQQIAMCPGPEQMRDRKNANTSCRSDAEVNDGATRGYRYRSDNGHGGYHPSSERRTNYANGDYKLRKNKITQLWSTTDVHASSHRGDFPLEEVLHQHARTWFISDQTLMHTGPVCLLFHFVQRSCAVVATGATGSVHDQPEQLLDEAVTPPGAEQEHAVSTDIADVCRIRFVALKIPPMPMGPLSVRKFYLRAARRKDPSEDNHRDVVSKKLAGTAENENTKGAKTTMLPNGVGVAATPSTTTGRSDPDCLTVRDIDVGENLAGEPETRTFSDQFIVNEEDPALSSRFVQFQHRCDNLLGADTATDANSTGAKEKRQEWEWVRYPPADNTFFTTQDVAATQFFALSPAIDTACIQLILESNAAESNQMPIGLYYVTFG
ncbi:unnamed protein product [Amoebophrya sp. A120]|nr:unnamed protein product [Amoebophrya sp. A120]|eukprot:GSA120T00018078001.1